MELDFDKYKAQQCCDNPACQYDGKTGEDNIRPHSRQHQQVYCNACKNIWVITKGTFFYNLKAPVSLVLEVLRLLSEGMGLRAVCRTKGVTPDAVGAWLLKAAKHVHEVTIYLERAMHLTQCQIDEFWSYTPGSPIFKAVQKKQYKALYRALTKSPKSPEYAVGACSELLYVDRSVGAP
jgi:transposase-like protein